MNFHWKNAPVLAAIDALGRRIDALGSALLERLTNMAATEQQLQDTLDAIKTDVGAAIAKLQGIISDLQAQIAAGTPVSQAQLDALKFEADGIDQALQAVINPPPPAP